MTRKEKVYIRKLCKKVGQEINNKSKNAKTKIRVHKEHIYIDVYTKDTGKFLGYFRAYKLKTENILTVRAPLYVEYCSVVRLIPINTPITTKLLARITDHFIYLEMDERTIYHKYSESEIKGYNA